MRYISLGSGSRGNATLVEYKGQHILVDCGFSRKVFVQRMMAANVDPVSLRAVFVTHEHGDHAKGVVKVCESLDIPFYTSFGTAKRMGWLHHPLWQCISADQVTHVSGLNIRAVVVPHDAHEPLQFVIHNDVGHKLGILSDLGSLTPYVIDAYQGCHALQVEANHDPDMLRNGPYPPSLVTRVAGDFGHLSNGQCADFIQRVRWPGLRLVTAGHISEKNNDRNLVSQVLAKVLECEPHQVDMLVQDEISPWYQITDF
ncbi:MAG: MBL fold metallo-hydrolase [Oleibacter sp.]|nr:MBL fold metallo-hydrolase [Thalassolituus sp.]